MTLPQAPQRHLGIVLMSELVLTDILTTGNVIVHAETIAGLPTGAVLRNARVSERGDIELLYEHPSFPEAKLGQPIHVVDVILSRITKDAA